MKDIKDAIKEGKNGWPLLWTSWPVYTTRDYDGWKMSYSVPGFVALGVLALTWINALGWGVYGLVELVGKVI